VLPLQGVGVLVTRPAHQAQSLCRLLEDEGAITARLPALQIQPVGDHRELTARVGPVDAFDLIVFTSANAVQFGAWLLEQRQDSTLAAVGPATARALADAGYPNSIVPRGGFDSENLLVDPAMVRMGQRVLLIKGLNGRDVLRQELTRRGAEVVVAEVYERRRATHSAAQLEAITSQLIAGVLQIITATSAEIVANLLNLAAPDMRREFERLHWLVPSARVAAAGRGLGLAAPLIQAASAEDHDLVAAILRWRSSESGA
jgi:uroporphyrinogen-III synthase